MGKRHGGGWYAVARGVHPGIYRSWEECKLNVHGFPGARFKQFSSQEQARVFIATHGHHLSTSAADVQVSKVSIDDELF